MKWSQCIITDQHTVVIDTYPVIMLSQEISQELQDIPRKCPFLLQLYKILQDNEGFCKNLARNCVDRFLQDSCKIPKVLEDLAGIQEKRTFSCNSCNVSYKSIKLGMKLNLALRRFKLQ